MGNSQCGIIYYSDSQLPGSPADGGAVFENLVFGTQIFDGIDVCSNRNQLVRNIVAESDESGIHLDSTCSGTGNDNVVVENVLNDACAGILNGGSANKIEANRFANVTSELPTGNSCPDPRGGSGTAGVHISVNPIR